MAIIGVIFLIIINVVMAAYHASLINQGRPIKHGWWGAGYLALAVLLSLLNNSWLLFVDLLLIRKVFFDLSLNLFRGKPLFYVSSTTTSIIDRVHNKIFGNRSEIYMIVYLIASIIITILL